jgi:hypothetical protein
MSIEDLRLRLETGAMPLNWAEVSLTAPLRKWIAMKDGDREFLKTLRDWPADRPYKHDPLADKISNAFADFLYGEDPTINPASTDDAERMEYMITQNDFSAELHQAVQTFSAEGEVWWRIYTDPEQIDAPLVEWHSRRVVYPMWRGRALSAVAFVNEVERTGSTITRYVQYHEPFRVVNVLYVAQAQIEEDNPDAFDPKALEKMGDEVPLTSNPYTEMVDPEWIHDLPILAGRVVNNVPRTRKIGKSDYDGVEDLLLDLDETHAIDGENYKLAGKKRAVMDSKYRASAQANNLSEEILWVDTDEDEMDPENHPFQLLEYEYDGDDSIKRKEDLERIIITRVGLVRQFTDSGTGSSDGWAQSGAALRTRLIPSALAARGKAREWDFNLPQVVRLMQRVDNLSVGQGGFGRGWANDIGVPSVRRQAILPEDPADEATRHQTLVTNELESIVTAIEELHPEWSLPRRMLEVRRIIAERNGQILDDDGNVIDVGGSLTDPSSSGGDESGSGAGGDGGSNAPPPPTPTPAPTSGGAEQ